ncbi:nitroreductase [Streptomyces sp. DSM 44917]|uniref:Nitroreductase n=1 Tax=Streptomyces boetiae TaxID=3075541 RepID=A0ABU2LEQ3_9ACTN|nr:nitroreductase [Streptomyces sp. DSM 44917]MDT0310055.1 nitroreductase [Streptomyces sp. DSM 44917]
MGDPARREAAYALVAAAVRAPSSHNTQPWAFRRGAGALLLYADRSRGLPANDPLGRELHISCGAALLNLRLAAAHHELTADVETLPDPADPGLLARVTLTPGAGPPPAEEERLHAEIGRRRTVRSRFAARPVAAPALDRAARAAGREGARLFLLPPGPARRSAAAAVREGARRQFGDRAWRRELASWIQPPSAGEGLTVPARAAPAARALIRAANLGRAAGRHDARLLLAAPAAAVLATEEDGRAAWLAAGQALQRALLSLAADGLAAGFVNQPCQVGPPLRGRIRDAARGGAEGAHPQLLFRVGHPAARPADSPRRLVADVLLP